MANRTQLQIIITALTLSTLAPVAYAQTSTGAAENLATANKDQGTCFGGKSIWPDRIDCFAADDFLGKLDLTTPDNPLFTLMGSSPETVIRPKTGNQLSASLLPQFADALGADRQSFAVEFNPGIAMIPDYFSPGEIRGEIDSRSDGSAARVNALRRARWLSPLTLTLAYSESEGDAKIASYGLGVNYVVDSGDPLRAASAYSMCLDQALKQQSETAPVRSLSEIQSELEREVIAELIKEGRSLDIAIVADEVNRRFANSEEARRTREQNTKLGQLCRETVSPWNRNVFGGGLALLQSESSLTEGGQTTNGMTEVTLPGNRTGIGVWASYSRQMGRDGLLTAGARYADNMVRQREADDSQITETLDSWSAGFRYTHLLAGPATQPAGGGEFARSVRAFAELAYTDEKFDTGKDSFYQAGVGIELQLQQNLFLQIIGGDTFSSSIDRGNYFNGRIKWAFRTQ